MITMILIMFIIMLAISISMYEVMRKSRPFGWLIKLIDKSFLLQMLFHFAIAFAIAQFSGDGMVSGGANLASTAIFPVYCAIRNSVNPTYRHINGGWF